MSNVSGEAQTEQDDFLAQLRGRMSTGHQRATEILGRVNAVYVESGRDTVLRNSFDRFLSYVMAPQRYGRQGKGNAFFITGESGAGKTDIVEHLLKEHPVMQPVDTGTAIVRPWATVSLQGPATLRTLGLGIFDAIQYRTKPNIKEAEVWRILPDQIKTSKILIIHIDETQHLLARGADQLQVASAIKGLMNFTPWPVSFILSGMPALNELILHDDQAERRNFSLALPPVHPEDDRDLIVDIIEKQCKAAELSCADFVRTDMPERIAHAANYQFGRICEVVITGIHVAVLANKPALERDHFAKAYRDHSNTRGLDEMNPFHVDDWTNLKPGYFVLAKEEGEQ